MSSSVSPSPSTYPQSASLCHLLFHPGLRHIHSQRRYVIFCFTPAFDISTVSVSVSSSVSPPPLTYPQSASLCHLLFHPRLRHIHSQRRYVIFCFTPAFDISTVSVAMSSSVSPPPLTYPQSASLCHLLFHPRLRHIHSQRRYVIFCFTPAFDISTVSVSVSSSVSPPPSTYPQSASLCHLLFHPRLWHIHSQRLCVIFCFTPAFDISIVSVSMSSSVSPPPLTYPQWASLCHLLFHPRLWHIHSQRRYVIFCFTPAFDISIVSVAMSSSVSPPPLTYP